MDLQQIRPVSAFEARQVSESTNPSNTQSLLDQKKEVQAQRNTEQFQDLTRNQSNVPNPENIPTEVIPTPAVPPTELSEQNPEELGSEIQPDAEPKVPSSEGSVMIPDPTEVPVPEGTDSEFVTQALY